MKTSDRDTKPDNPPIPVQTTRLIQSYVKDRYFVSTVHRQCSAALAPEVWYYETMVWEWDAATKDRGVMLSQHDSGRYRPVAMASHIRVCELFLPHLHVAENEDGELMEECGKCGADIRDWRHLTENQ